MDWFYYNETGQKIGPINVPTLRELVKCGIIKQDTIIENSNGRSSKAGDVKGLKFPKPATPASPTIQQDALPNTPSGSPKRVAVPLPSTEVSSPFAPINLGNAYGAVLSNEINKPFTESNIMNGGRSASGRLQAIEYEPVVYTPRNANSVWLDFFSILFDGTPPATGGIFNDHGKPVIPQITSSDGNILKIRVLDSGNIEYFFCYPGTVNVKFQVGNETVIRSVQVIEVPITVQLFINSTTQKKRIQLGISPMEGTASTVRETIQCLGFPDEEIELSVEYPQSLFGNGLVYGIYDPEFRQAKHLKYHQKYPGLVVSVIGGQVFAISSYSANYDHHNNNKHSSFLLDHRVKEKDTPRLTTHGHSKANVPNDFKKPIHPLYAMGIGCGILILFFMLCGILGSFLATM